MARSRLLAYDRLTRHTPTPPLSVPPTPHVHVAGDAHRGVCAGARPAVEGRRCLHEHARRLYATVAAT
eukprot:7295141-Prymnesium_polylepis.1